MVSPDGQESYEAGSKVKARQEYYDLIDGQGAFAPIGNGYIPQYGSYGYQPQPQMIGYGQYEQGYGAMSSSALMMIPLAVLLCVLICIGCLLCNALIGVGCFFAGKTVANNEKKLVEKECAYDAV